MCVLQISAMLGPVEVLVSRSDRLSGAVAETFRVEVPEEVVQVKKSVCTPRRRPFTHVKLIL
jgi:hypothetical protein